MRHSVLLSILLLLGTSAQAALPLNFSGEALPAPEDIDAAVRPLERLCSDLALGCENFPGVEVIFSADPIKIGAHPYAGTIDETGSTIRIEGTSPQLRETLFHELVHWVHTHSGKRDRSWMSEAIPHLASLIYLPSLPLTPAEAEYRRTRLSGTLLAGPDAQDSEWFGLVGLWTRYLAHLSADPRALLGQWIRSGGPLPDLSAMRFMNENLKPVPAGIKSLTNLVNYFAIALYADLRGVEPWGLYSLGPNSGQVSADDAGRMISLRRGTCVTLPPMGFTYAWADVLRDDPTLDFSPAVRAILWKGGQAPVTLVARNPNLHFYSWDRIIIYNSGLTPDNFCVH